MKISVVVITLNEEQNIEECLRSVQWADERLVVDSGSKDKTVEIAGRLHSRVLSHPFTNFAEQKNYAISQASGDWILILDADERVSPELAGEIRGVTGQNGDLAVYEIRRRTYFFNKPLRFSGTQKDAPIRLLPKGKARFEQPVHEYISTDLPVKRLKSTLLHLTTRNLAQYQEKLERYVGLEIETMRLNGRRFYFWDVWIRPAAKFLKLYIFQLGILDGLTGLQLAILSAYYDFLKLKRFNQICRG